jgi:hypothetical protein
MPETLALLCETSDPPNGKEGASTNSIAGPMTRGRTQRDPQLAEGGTSQQAGVSRQPGTSRQPGASRQARASQGAGPSHTAPSTDASA